MLETPGSGNPWPYHYDTSRWTRWLVGIFWLGRGGREYLRDLRYTRARRPGRWLLIRRVRCSDVKQAALHCVTVSQGVYLRHSGVEGDLRLSWRLELLRVGVVWNLPLYGAVYSLLSNLMTCNRQPQVSYSQAAKFQDRAKVGACDMQ